MSLGAQHVVEVEDKELVTIIRSPSPAGAGITLQTRKRSAWPSTL